MNNKKRKRLTNSITPLILSLFISSIIFFQDIQLMSSSYSPYNQNLNRLLLDLESSAESLSISTFLRQKESFRKSLNNILRKSFTNNTLKKDAHSILNYMFPQNSKKTIYINRNSANLMKIIENSPQTFTSRKAFYNLEKETHLLFEGRYETQINPKYIKILNIYRLIAGINDEQFKKRN